MRICYLTTLRFPTEKAHGWQIAKMCDAFAQLGHDVRLVIPSRRTAITASPENYYRLCRPLRVERLPSTDALAWRFLPRRLAFGLTVWSFERAVRQFLAQENLTDTVIITRDQFILPLLVGRARALVLEAHDVPSSFFRRLKKWASSIDLFVAANRWQADEAARVWMSAPPRRMVVLPNGVDLTVYEKLPSKEDARRALGLPVEARLAVYTGHLYAWKGVFTLAHACRALPADWRVVLVGGTTEDHAKMDSFLRRQRLDRVILVPHVPPERVPLYLAAADCLALPNSGRDWNSRYTTSPIKLWEYLAARRPVVASDLPSIRDLVTEREVRFVPPDDAAALAGGLTAAVGDAARTAAGWEAVQSKSWSARAAQIFDGLELIKVKKHNP